MTGFPVFSIKTVEAYWLGNSHLYKFKNEHYKILLRCFKKQGVPDWLINELSSKKPKKFIPNHLFQVLHVGVGRASGSVPYNIKTINNCMVRWGKILRVSDSKADVLLNSLSKKQRLFKLTLRKDKCSYSNEFTPTINKGDIVAVHWGLIIKVLTRKEQQNIRHWTGNILKSINKVSKIT